MRFPRTHTAGCQYPQASRGDIPSQPKLLLLRLDLVALRPRRGPVLGLYLGPLLAQTPVDRVLGRVAAPGGLVHESPGVALLERGDDVLACWGSGILLAFAVLEEMAWAQAYRARSLCEDGDAWLAAGVSNQLD